MSNSPQPDVSVVIPFRNREVQRLRRAVESLHAAAGNLAVEIIVSDFGSDEDLGIADLCAEQGAKHVYTEASRWSRAACLNRGIAAARGRLIQSDDADMIWVPQSLERHARRMLESQDFVLAHQVWDLPERLTGQILGEQWRWDWEELRNAATSHSRWGHGLLLMPAEAASAVNGYDERMHTYGVEDLDLTQRLRRAGYPLRWGGHAGDELFHIWHKSTSQAARTDPKIVPILQRNRQLYREDPSIIRNLTSERYGVSAAHRPPMVTVAIASRDRADLLREALVSVKAQTFGDWEAIVADDGSEDHTKEVVEEMNDARFRYIRLEKEGISAARNAILDVSRGKYTAVLDDDDLMLPARLEVQLQAVIEGVCGVVGHFANFDDETGQIVMWGDREPSLYGAYASGGFAGHPTWLVETSWLRSVRYEQAFSSAVDNNIALRLLRAGATFTHCKQVVTMRRRHTLQVTDTDGRSQKIGARLNHEWLKFGQVDQTEDRVVEAHAESQKSIYPDDGLRVGLPAYLPDRLVSRTVEVSWDGGFPMPALPVVGYDITMRVGESEQTTWWVLPNATWDDMALLRQAGFSVRILDYELRTVELDESGVGDQQATDQSSILTSVRERVLESLNGADLVLELPYKHQDKLDVLAAESASVVTVQCPKGDLVFAGVAANDAPRLLAGLGPFRIVGGPHATRPSKVARMLDGLKGRSS